MDIEEFLDRELSDIDSRPYKPEKPDKIQLQEPEHKEDFETSPLFENVKDNLNKGNIEEAEQSYVQLWRILLQQKLKWNKELHEQLTILARQFENLLKESYNEVKSKADSIYQLIRNGMESIRQGKKDAPYKIYSQIQEINNSIPNAFFEEKKVIQEQIMNFYRELTNTADNDLINRVSVLIQKISQLLDQINYSIRSNDMINASVNYNKCIELYSQIPEGFLRYKNSLGMRLLEIYKSISIYTEISNLQRQMSSSMRQNGLNKR